MSPQSANAVRETGPAALSRLMTEQQLSQRGLAKKASEAGQKLPQATISGILSHETEITLPTAQTLAAVFDVSPALFLPDLADIIRPAGATAAPLAFEGSECRIPLTEIHRWERNPRKTFHEDTIREMADSIVAKGQLQNLIVRPRPEGGFWIVTGERRWRGFSLLAEEARLPAEFSEFGLRCIVRQLNDSEALQIAIVENLQREDVEPLEEAEAFAELQSLDPETFSAAGIAAQIGRSPRHVQLRLALVNKLVPEAAAALKAGTINLASARALTTAPPDAQREILDRVGRTYRRTEDIVRAVRQETIPASRALFDPSLYTGASVVDDETGETIFHDGKMFRALQNDAIAAKEKALRESGTGVVITITGRDWWQPAPYNLADYFLSTDLSSPPVGSQRAAVIHVKGNGSVDIYDKLLILLRHKWRWMRCVFLIA